MTAPRPFDPDNDPNGPACELCGDPIPRGRAVSVTTSRRRDEPPDGYYVHPGACPSPRAAR